MTTFTLSSSVLTAKCDKLIKVVSAKNTIPVLDNFLFMAKSGVMTITAADSEITARTIIELEKPADFIFAVDAKNLISILKELGEQPLEFNIKNNACVIKYHNGHFEFPLSIDAEQFPYTMTEYHDFFTLKGSSFSRILKKCIPFVGHDDLRPIMNGVWLNFDEKTGKMEAVSSDGHGLAKVTEKCVELKGNGSVVLTEKTAKLIDSMMGKDEDTISVSFDQRALHVKLADYEIHAKQVEGSIPKYNAVIPSFYTDYIEVDRKELLGVIRRVMAGANTVTTLIKYMLQGCQMTLKGEDIDYSKSSEELMMVNKHGADLTIGLKGVLTQSILNAFDGESVRIEYSTGSAAVVYKNLSDNDEYELLIIQMPMLV